MPRKSSQIALGGLSSALCLTLMLLSAVLPFSTYAFPALAGIALIPVAVEMGLPTAAVSYAAVSILSFTMVPDLETALMFAAFFGYYPFLKLRLDKLRRRVLRISFKFAIFNLSMASIYWLMIYLLGMVYILEEFSGGFGWLLLILGNIGFWIYDLALRNVTAFYRVRLKKILFGQRK